MADHYTILYLFRAKIKSNIRTLKHAKKVVEDLDGSSPVRLIPINIDDHENAVKHVTKAMRKLELEKDVLLDPKRKSMDKYKLKKSSHMFIIDRHGIVRRHFPNRVRLRVLRDFMTLLIEQEQRAQTDE